MPATPMPITRVFRAAFFTGCPRQTGLGVGAREGADLLPPPATQDPRGPVCIEREERVRLRDRVATGTVVDESAQGFRGRITSRSLISPATTSKGTRVVS